MWAAFDFTKTMRRVQGSLDNTVVEEHLKHGEIVRVGRNELSFIDPAAWKDIYGHGHAELKKYFPPNTINPNQIIATPSPSDHFRMRRAFLPAFSEKAIAQQEKLIRVYIDLLVQRLGELAEAGEPANMTKWYNLATFDLIADLTFGKSLNGLESGKSNQYIEKIEKMLRIMPVIMLMSSFPSVAFIVKTFFGKKMNTAQQKHLEFAASLAKGRIHGKEQADRGDFMDFILRSRGQEHQVKDIELIHNSDLFMVAGSETTATLLMGVTFNLLKTPEAYRKVTEEVRNAFSSPDEINFRDATQRLPYMMACLSEALRIYPPAPLAMFRVTNPGAMTPIAGKMIPPGVRILSRPLPFCSHGREANPARLTSVCTTSPPITAPSTSTTPTLSAPSDGCQKCTTTPSHPSTTTDAMYTSPSRSARVTASDETLPTTKCDSSSPSSCGISTSNWNPVWTTGTAKRSLASGPSPRYWCGLPSGRWSRFVQQRAFTF